MEHEISDLKRNVALLLDNAQFKAALDYVRTHLPETIEIQKELTLIEAPTGQEKKKAERYKQLLQDAGLEDVIMDRHFNVVGRIKGTAGSGKSVLLEGHLDTVFSFGDVKQIEIDDEGKIHCPGICDDTRALAANLAVLKALKTSGLKPVHDIYFAGTVQEEGLGGMSGMAWLLDKLKNETHLMATISIDGPTAEDFYANATGMTDWEVTYEGPGGHAWTASSRPSAIHAAGIAISELARLRLPEEPKTTMTVSLTEGGQAIHGIAQKAVFTINARSNSQKELDELGSKMIKCFEKGLAEENSKTGCDGALKLTYKKTLDIPAGSQDDNARIIQLTKLATEAVGRTPNFKKGGCTNTNMSIARKIPAVTLGRGGQEFGTHTLNEWFNPDGVYACEQKSLIMLAVIAGLDNVIEPLGETF